ncbi:metal ABC transporter ATP-binding protein [Egicoccus halophilus]|uniref:ABC transporter ATP-binding protein n=1 Tax=Egicoccus halophilus TaxID=1670830 RepID=A0A8J3AA74_9ACTN|nr:metal ABC transporter ATP-binding protein [Egicoccus halophilus]GGI08310.1 ABC transporter ATP-binding protein [Egicoccus halophilus]
MAPAPAVELVDVTAGYGAVPVLERLSLRVEAGELVGVVGPSGAGKTTLLRLLTGDADRHHGEVRLFGEPVGRRPPRRVGVVPQLGTIDWDFPLRVREAVLLGLVPRTRRVPWFARDERQRVDTLLERLGIGELGDRFIRELSGGQQQRVLLARALVREADLLLLDEPTSGVDLATRHDVLHLIGELNAEGIAVLLTTHDLNWVATHLPRIVCFASGVVADGPPGSVLTSETLMLTYGAPMRVVRDGGTVVVVDEEPLLEARSPAVPPTRPLG